jgi:hypothetical protein
MDIRMLKEVLLHELGASYKDDTYTLRDDHRVTIVLAHDGGTLAVSKIRAVRVVGELIALHTEEGRTFAEPGDIFALRVEEQDKAESRTGFHR